MFISSKFYTAVLLISTFILLAVIPSITYSIIGLLDIETPLTIAVLVLISLYASATADDLIYIFLYAPIRNLIKSRASRLFNRNPNVTVSVSTISRSV